MEGLLSLAQNNQPILLTLVIIGGLVQIIYLILKQTGLIRSKKLSADGEFKKIIKAMTEELHMSNKIATNHTHSIPDIHRSIEKIEEALVRLADNLDRRFESQNKLLNDNLNKQNEILIRLETNRKQ